MSKQALIWAIGICVITASTVVIAVKAYQRASYEADVRHRCEHISHSKQAQLIPFSTTSGIVLMPVDVTEDCYRCRDGFVECF